MPSLYFRLRIRNADNTADALVVTSQAGGTNPYLVGIPDGDGTSVDPFTGKVSAGQYTVRIADPITSGTSRLFTALLEDAGLRQQLGDRRAFLEYNLNAAGWTGLFAGRLTRYALADDATWEVAVSDPSASQQGYQLFAPQAGDTVADFLARWPNRGCIFGGPVIGGFGPLKDYGGWQMQVAEHSPGIAPATYLKFVAGYGPPKFERTTRVRDHSDLVNAKTQDRFTSAAYFNSDTVTTFAQAWQSNWPGLVVVIGGTAYRPVPLPSYFSGQNGTGDRYRQIVQGDGKYPGVGIDGDALAVSSAIVRVRLVTAEVSDLSPIYWDGHPVDFLAAAWNERGLPYSATALETVRDAIGRQQRVAFRVTAPQDAGSFLEQNIYGPFGIGVRPNASGEMEAFTTRIFANTLPTTTLTDADVVHGSTDAFALDTSSAYRRVLFTHRRLVTTDKAYGDAQNTPDGFVEQPETIERDNGDSGAIGEQDLTFDIAGMVHTADVWASDAARLTDALALEVFDRAGRGLVEAGTTALRGGSGDALRLGEECLVDLPQLPNHNKRLGDDGSVAARAMQVVHWTPVVEGLRLRLADSGPNAQPVATLPTVTIAASTTHPRTVARVTITNAATLNASTIGVRLQMATTTGGAPNLADYGDVAAWAGGTVPTDPVDLAPVDAGRTVYVRARSEQPDHRPSDWSTGVSVTLTAIDAPTGLTVSVDPSDSGRAFAFWTAGSNATDCVSDVYLRLSTETDADAVRRAVLPIGSSQVQLDGLTAGTAYVVGVEHRDPGTGHTSTRTTASFTAGSTTATVAAPADAFGFAGTQDPAFGLPADDGLYGLAVAATVFPSFVEFLEAVETSVGSGTFGTAAVVAKVASVQGDWTVYRNTAANDGLLRRLTARHVDGANTSTSTDAVDVLPWASQPLQPFATATGVYALQNFRRTSETATTRIYGWTRGALVDRVCVYQRTLPIYSGSDPWPTASDTPTILPVGTDALTLTKPSAGNRLYVQVEARDFDLNPTQIRRILVEPVSALTVTVTPSEGSGQGNLAVAVTDPASVLAAVNPVQFRRTVDQTTTTVAPTTTVGSTYTRTETLDTKHAVRLEPLLTYADGSTQTLAAYTFDADRIADMIAGPVVSYSGSTARITARFDSDATAGANQAFYRTGGSGSWTGLTVASDLTVDFTVTASATATTQVELYAVNPDSSAGPVTTFYLSKVPEATPGVASFAYSSTNYTTDTITLAFTLTNANASQIVSLDRSVDGGETWSTGVNSVFATNTTITDDVSASYDLITTPGPNVTFTWRLVIYDGATPIFTGPSIRRTEKHT